MTAAWIMDIVRREEERLSNDSETGNAATYAQYAQHFSLPPEPRRISSPSRRADPSVDETSLHCALPVGSGYPAQFSLEQNYPNPFNPSTTIRFRVRWEGVVTLSVYDVLGQLLDRRSFGLAAGGYEIVWSSKGAAGALFYSIEEHGERLTRKMIQLDGGSHGGWGELRTTQSISTVTGSLRGAEVEYKVVASKLGMPSRTT